MNIATNCLFFLVSIKLILTLLLIENNTINSKENDYIHKQNKCNDEKKNKTMNVCTIDEEDMFGMND